MGLTLTHIGLCVADLSRARRFYCDGLGFSEVSKIEVAGEPAATLLELAEVDLEAVYLERDGFRLELLHYRNPGVAATAVPRPMNVPGLTHLSFRVDDVDATAERLCLLGGTLLPGTRIELPGLGAVAAFVVDPDGTRIELVRLLS